MTTPTTPEACREAQEHWQKRVDAYDAALAELRRLSDGRTVRYADRAKAAEEKGEVCPSIPDPTPEYWAASEAWADAQKAFPAPKLARDHANLLAAHAEALAAQRWIPVSERLPKMDVDVLVFDGRDTFIAYRTESGWEQLPNIYHQPHGITHWQPLPAPPAPASAEGGAE